MTNLIRRFFSIRYMLKPSQHTDKPLPATKEVYKRQFDLTWPCAVESVLVSLIGSIDTMMVGGIGPEAIAAVGITNQPKFILLAVIFSLNVGVTSFTTILSMFLTNDEGFILTIISNVVVVWVVITLFLFIKKVQDFTFWETVKNILITIFLIIVILIAAALIYSLWNSISEFLVSVYREVFYRGLNK